KYYAVAQIEQKIDVARDAALRAGMDPQETMNRYTTVRLFLLALVTLAGFSGDTPVKAQWLPKNSVQSAKKLPDGTLVTLETGYLRCSVLSDSIVHLVYSLEAEPKLHEQHLVVRTSWPAAAFELHNNDAKKVTLKTSSLKLEIARED